MNFNLLTKSAFLRIRYKPGLNTSNHYMHYCIPTLYNISYIIYYIIYHILYIISYIIHCIIYQSLYPYTNKIYNTTTSIFHFVY